MKKLLLFIMLAATLTLTSCQFDDSEIWDAINEHTESIKDHEERISALEELCKQMNTNPSGGPDHFRAPRHIIWQTVQGRRPARPSVAQPLRAASRC